MNRRTLVYSALCLSIISGLFYHPAKGAAPQSETAAYVLVFIGDGMGANHLLAANSYTQLIPSYQSWQTTWMTTYPNGGNYDPISAWQYFSYATLNPTDSAAAATAMFSGVKTNNGIINVNPDKSYRYMTISDIAQGKNYSIGAVTTAPLSDATPAGWVAHNDSRLNGFAIADEAYWGNPNTTGTPDLPYYGGGHGLRPSPVDVLIGGGHPSFYPGNRFVNNEIITKLRSESSLPGKHRFVERIANQPDGGIRLLTASELETTTKLAGIFGGANGDFEFRLADGSGTSLENPSLSEMTLAAIQVLQRNSHGFLLLVEGGTIDHAAHANNMNAMIGEVIGFNEAVQTAIEWVEDPASPANWDNTLMIIAADHETGYLTKAPGVTPDVPLSEITTTRLSLEKTVLSTGRRASWQDNDSDSEIDDNEEVYWAWNSNGHTNSLVRVFVKGAGSVNLSHYVVGSDPVRGDYIDNTAIFKLIQSALMNTTVYLPIVLGSP